MTAPQQREMQLMHRAAVDEQV